MATDALHELAEQHPELLTRECDPPLFCPACQRVHRRLLTLEEAVNELVSRGHLPVMFWGDEAHGSTVECCTDETCCTAHRAEGSSHREAAYRLLIEVSRD